MKRLVLVLTALTLTGCATPRERIRTVEVKVPVPVTCVPTVPPAPTYAGDRVDLASDIFQLVQALLIEREQRRAREIELQAALTGCR